MLGMPLLMQWCMEPQVGHTSTFDLLKGPCVWNPRIYHPMVQAWGGGCPCLQNHQSGKHTFCSETALPAGGTLADSLPTDTRDQEESVELEITRIHQVLLKLWPHVLQKGVVPPLACLHENGGALPLLSHLACGAKVMHVVL